MSVIEAPSVHSTQYDHRQGSADVGAVPARRQFLLVGDSEGNLSQWFMVRDDKTNSPPDSGKNFSASRRAVEQIVSEERRKGFFVAGSQGVVSGYYSTANRLLVEAPLDTSGVSGWPSRLNIN